MDIELFSRIIKDLLACNERACIPNFGIFTIVEMPASFSDKGFTLNPPYYRIDFIPSADDDGEFLRLYSASNGLDRSRAEKLLAMFLSDFKTELFGKKVVALPGLGRLKVASGNFLIFVQDEGLNILPRFDCLAPVSLKSLSSPVIREVPGENMKPVPEVAQRDVVQPVPEVAQRENAKPEMKKRGGVMRWHTLPLVILVLVLVALAALAIAGCLFPQLVDPFLYDAAQLEILNAVL